MKKPAAKRSTLTLIAGMVWSLTGIGLSTAGIYWLSGEPGRVLMGLIALGLAIGIVVYRFKFGGIARENLERIYAQSPGNEKVCVFAFQNIRSYILVAIMMAMGYTLRHSGIPKVYLAPMYLAIGTGMLWSSFVYYRHLWSGQ